MSTPDETTPDETTPSPMGRERTVGQMGRRIGRVLLWAFVLLVLVRGIGAILSPPPEPRAQPTPSAQQRWPGDAAGAYAVSFAKAYLTWTPKSPEFHEQAVKPYLASRLRAGAGLEVPDEGRYQVVEEATVAGAHALGRDRALVTVAATVSGRQTTNRHLTVPVARDRRGGLVVYDYPSFSAPPARAAVADERTRNLPREDARAVEDVLDRFFRAFLGGRSSDLDYFLPSGTRLAAVRQRYELDEIVGLEQLATSERRDRTVLAVVRARDTATDATYLLRYRIDLVLRDRWYVARLNSN